MSDDNRLLVRSSDAMLGKYIVWLTRNKRRLNIDNGEYLTLVIVAESTLSCKTNRAYISLEHFEESGISHSALRKKRTSLTKENLIKWRKTSGFTMYELVLPNEITDKYDFVYKE
jgi:hypothetical protein